MYTVYTTRIHTPTPFSLSHHPSPGDPASRGWTNERAGHGSVSAGGGERRAVIGGGAVSQRGGGTRRQTVFSRVCAGGGKTGKLPPREHVCHQVQGYRHTDRQGIRRAEGASH